MLHFTVHNMSAIDLFTKNTLLSLKHIMTTTSGKNGSEKITLCQIPCINCLDPQVMANGHDVLVHVVDIVDPPWPAYKEEDGPIEM